MSTWGALYLGQVAFGMWLWSVLQYGGLTGWVLGLLPAVPFALLALAMWNARDYFHAPPRSLIGGSGDLNGLPIRGALGDALDETPGEEGEQSKVFTIELAHIDLIGNNVKLTVPFILKIFD